MCLKPFILNLKQKNESFIVYFDMCVDAIRDIRYFTAFILYKHLQT